MLRKKKTSLAPRPPRFDRFQTAVGGLGFVPSAIGARFDPYGEPARRPRRSAEEMERVERVVVEPRQLGDAMSKCGRSLPGSEAQPQPDPREGGSK